jgi:hypothetical protein
MEWRWIKNKQKTWIKHKNIFTLDGKEIGNVDKFPYLGSVVTKDGSLEDVRNKIAKANGAFNKLQKVWQSSGISLRRKIRIFNANVKSTLLHRCETLRVTQEMCKKLQSFVNQCLHRMVKGWWPLTITKDELWKQTNEIKIIEQITRCKLNWIGHS